MYHWTDCIALSLAFAYGGALIEFVFSHGLETLYRLNHVLEGLFK